MRNLTLAATERVVIPNANVTGTAVDPDQDILYAVSESTNRDGQVEVEIWRIDQDNAQLFAIVSEIASAASAFASQLASVRILPENRQMVLVLRFGDIISLSLQNDSPTPQVEGTVEPGILAAAWSPDDSALALVTGEKKLILMTNSFDVLSEAPLQTTEFGQDAPINVGWGSKQTQFHGSLGKAAAQTQPPVLVGSSPDDDTLPRISWRGDALFFVVSALSTRHSETSLSHRVLRVYDRQGLLQSTSEAVPGLEHTLSWQPSGNLIAGTQRFGFEGGGAGKGTRHDVVFLERNGLRHGEFGLRMSSTKSAGKLNWGYNVKEVLWSPDSNVLALWIHKEGGGFVQLWTSGNYHWYLKQEITGSFTSVEWHREASLRLIVTTSTQLIQRTYVWETINSPSPPPNDSGSVAVFDGSEVLLTPFRTQNIPPPMCSQRLSLTKLDVIFHRSSSLLPIHASFSEGDSLAVLWETGYTEVWGLQTRLGLDTTRSKVMNPVKLSYSMLNEDPSTASYRQVALIHSAARAPMTVVQLATRFEGTEQGVDNVTVVTIDTGSKKTVVMPTRNGRLVSVEPIVVWQSPEGTLYKVDFEENVAEKIGNFPQFCFTAASTTADPVLYFGQTENGKLFVTNQGGSSRLVVSNATSFAIASGFLIFTSTTHEVTFVPLSSLSSLLTSNTTETDVKIILTSCEKRAVERGSRIVTAVPSAMSLVLQMPRGNLETINPRPLVMAVVRQDIDSTNYRKAFLACRKHRIDLNVIVEHNQDGFLNNVGLFLEQVHEVDHINLFLANIGRGSLPSEVVSKICDAIRQELEKKDLKNYVNCVLTAHVVKTPPDHEAGLASLLRLRDADPSLVEDAVKYIIFLVDADKLFDTALGMYDFSLVLMIAQHAQKDPREYLPFLRELRTLERYYQRFKIDDHLKRYESALRNLSLAGPTYFDEALEYAELHRLYTTALSIWNNTERYKDVLVVYGDWLFERREFRQAATAFVEAGSVTKAMIAHEKALQWQELFDLAMRTGIPEDDLGDMGYRVAAELASKKRYAEGAQILFDYSQDVREAIITLVQGNLFSEARRMVTLKRSPELLEEVIHPAVLESCGQIAEDMNEMKEQLQKQLNRIKELRIKKVEEPEAFYGAEDTHLHNVDVMTDISMPGTTFTRYTAAPSTAVSRKSKQSSRSKRKMERKVGSGRKGTVDEEEYLLKSISKLVVRFKTTKGEARSLLPHLFEFTSEHRADGLALQKDLDALEAELKEALELIWTKPKEAEAQQADSWAQRMEEIEKTRQINPVDRVPKPEFEQEEEWRIKLLDLGHVISVS